MEMPEVDVPEVDVDELEIALIQGGVLIDVREAEEFEAVRVPGAPSLRGSFGRTGPTRST